MISESNLKKKAAAPMKDNPLAGLSPAKRTNSHDMKDLGMVDDTKGKGKRGDSDKLNQSGLGAENFEDSFQKLYSKELDLDEDEVPIILHELNDSAIHFISREQFERSLSLLQKAQTLLDRLQFQKNPNDRFLVQVTMHNMALCFQKMGALEECALCLDACLHQLNSQYLLPKFQGSPTKKLKKLKYECKIHMQVCALLSQLHRHSEALCHAKRAVQISQYLVRDLQGLCKVNYEKSCEAKIREQVVHEEIERKREEEKKKKKKTHSGAPDNYLHSLSREDSSSKLDLIYYEHSVSMLERTAYRVYPIIKEVAARMVPEKDVEKPDLGKKQNVSSPVSSDQHTLNMKVLLGYLNQSEWLFLLNIGNIMQITPLTIHDLYTTMSIDVELARDAVLEKICYLCISYFCVSTELRFLVQTKEKLVINQTQVKQESEFWHAKALEISCSFLPSESPLVSHILSSYQKHHAPVQEAIPEDSTQESGVKVIRPIKGIDKCQYQPIVRFNKNLSIALSPLSLSPNNYGQKKPIITEIESTGIRNQPRLEPNDYSSHGTGGIQSVSVTKNNITHKTQSRESVEEEEIPMEQIEINSSTSEPNEQLSAAVQNPTKTNTDPHMEDKDNDVTIPTEQSIQARTKQSFPPKLTDDQEKDLRHLIKNSSDGKEQAPSIRNQRPQTSTNRKEQESKISLTKPGGTFKTDESNGEDPNILHSRFQFHSNKVSSDDRPKSKHGHPQSAKVGQTTPPTNLSSQKQNKAATIINQKTITQESSAESAPDSVVGKQSSGGSGILLMNQMSGSTSKSSNKAPKQQPHQSKFEKMKEDVRQQKSHVMNMIPDVPKSKKFLEKEAKSTAVSNKGTGKLFENLEECLDHTSVTQNSVDIPRQSSASSGTRKVKRPSSNHPARPGDPVNIQVLTQNQLDNSVNRESNRSSSVGRTRRKVEQQKPSKISQNFNLAEGSKHSFASNNNVSSTKDMHANLGGKSEHSRSVISQQQRSQNFLSAKSNRTLNQDPSRELILKQTDVRMNELQSRDGDFFQEGNQIIDVQTRQKTTSQQKTQQNFALNNAPANIHQSLVKPQSQPAKNGQRGLMKKASPSQGKNQVSGSSSKQSTGGNYQKQKQFKDMIGLLVLQQQQQKGIPQSKTSVTTPNVHSNQGTTNVVNLLQSIPSSNSLELQKANLMQSVMNSQTNPPSRRKSASTKVSKGQKQQKMANDFQTQLQPSKGQFGPTLTTSQSQVQFTSAINGPNGVVSSDNTRHKVNRGENQGLSTRIDELMMGVGSGPGGFEFAGKQTKSQTNLQLQKNQQKSIQTLFNQRVGAIEKNHSRADNVNQTKSKSQEKNQQKQSSNKQTSQISQFNSVINSSNNHMSKLNQVYSSQVSAGNSAFGSNMPTALIGSKMSSKHLQKLQQQRQNAGERFTGQSGSNGQKKERELTPVFPTQQPTTQLTRPDQMFPGSLGQGSNQNSAIQSNKYARQGGQPAVLTANSMLGNDQFNMKASKHKKHTGAVTAVPVAGQNQDNHARSRMQQQPSNSAVDVTGPMPRPSKTEVPSPNGGRDNLGQWQRHLQ